MKQTFEPYSDGKSLYGDDFSQEQIDAWFRDEAEAYYNLPLEQEIGVYSYHARNWRHGFRYLPKSRFDRVLCLGGAFGDELQPVLDRASQVTVLEPASEFQNPRFEYVKPDPSGRMPFADNTFDLATCFGVLHHIPNVSVVMRELGRSIKPGGFALICEPVHSMGNWDRPRHMLTSRERGIPPEIMRRMVVDSGFNVIRARRCMFSLTSRFQYLLPKRKFVYNTSWITALDDYICSLPVWPDNYHATNVFQKLRPLAFFLVLQKRNDAAL
jgi:SAM-dependent methyltransferase